MGSAGLLLYRIILVRATIAMSATITIVKNLPIFSFQHYLLKVFYSLVKTCIEPKCVNLTKLNAGEAFAQISIHFSRGKISSSVSWQSFTFALVVN